jgi:hypothetical protein
MTGRLGRRHKQLLDDFRENRILEIERGNTRSHSLENALRKRLWTSRKTDYRMNKSLRCIATLTFKVCGKWHQCYSHLTCRFLHNVVVIECRIL